MNTIILAAPCVIVAVFAACRRDAPTAALASPARCCSPSSPSSPASDLRSTGPGLTAGGLFSYGY